MDWENFSYKINDKYVMLTILFDYFYYFFMIFMTSYIHYFKTNQLLILN